MKNILLNKSFVLGKRAFLFLGFCFFAAAFSPGGPYAQSAAAADLPMGDNPLFWRQAIGGVITGYPSAQAESVVMTSDSGSVKAYSWRGRPLWDFYARGKLVPFVSRSREGTSYFCRVDGTLFALNRVGRELWRKRLGGAIISPVLTGWDGRLFVFTTETINCYTASGFSLWSQRIEKNISVFPEADGRGGFYLVFEDGELLIVDAFGSSSSVLLDGVPAAAARLKTGNRGGSSLLFFYESGVMEILDTANGNREKIENISGAPNPLVPAAASGYLSGAALLLQDGNAAYLSLAERKIVWQEKTHLDAGEIRSQGFEAKLLFDERGIYLLTKSGASGFGIDGKRLWLIKIKNAASISTFSDEGVLYSGGSDWILYAYRLEERIAAREKELYGPAPEGSYGTGLPRPELWKNYPARYSESEIQKSFAEIRRAIESGRIGSLEKLHAARLIDIAGSELNIHRLGKVPVPVMPDKRAEAARLLSYFGSRETVPFLVELFKEDGDNFVKAAAADALGRIGVDPEGLALNAFWAAIFPPSSLTDGQALTSIAAASGAICRFSGPPLSDLGIRILTFLAGAEKPGAVRRQAGQELRSLRR